MRSSGRFERWRILEGGYFSLGKRNDNETYSNVGKVFAPFYFESVLLGSAEVLSEILICRKWWLDYDDVLMLRKVHSECPPEVLNTSKEISGLSCLLEILKLDQGCVSMLLILIDCCRWWWWWWLEQDLNFHYVAIESKELEEIIGATVCGREVGDYQDWRRLMRFTFWCEGLRNYWKLITLRWEYWACRRLLNWLAWIDCHLILSGLSMNC